MKECTYCQGTGEIHPEDGDLDLDSLDALRGELMAVVTANRKHAGLKAEARHDRMQTLGRISFLTGRIMWLESTEQAKEDNQAKYGPALAL